VAPACARRPAGITSVIDNTPTKTPIQVFISTFPRFFCLRCNPAQPLIDNDPTFQNFDWVMNVQKGSWSHPGNGSHKQPESFGEKRFIYFFAGKNRAEIAATSGIPTQRDDADADLRTHILRLPARR
jgi:hypothetical protein